MRHSGSNPSGIDRPDLLSVRAGEGAKDNRILASLEGGGSDTTRHRAHGRGGRRGFVLGGFVLAGILVGWFVYQNRLIETRPFRELTPTPNIEGSQQAPMIGATGGPIVKLSSSEALLQAAVINDDRADELATSFSPVQDSLQADMGMGDAEPVPSTIALLEALEGTGEKTGRTSAGKTESAPKRSQAASNKSARKAPSRSTKQANRPNTKADSDVALLTALVSAVNETDPALPSLQGQAEVQTGQPNRDIVERTLRDSTDSLVARCKQLGFLEGELCRWRICSGHESEPVCSAS